MSLDILNGLIEDVIATQSVDMTEESTGGGALMPEGYAMARMVTYIELGMQPQEFNGKAKAPAPEVILGFKLFGGQDNCYDGRFLSTFPLALGNSTKANAKVAFDRMNWQGDMRHFAQGLGRGFLLPITIHTNEKTKKQSNRINLKGLLPPIDPVSKGAYPIPEVTAEDLKYFFFDRPTKETWDSLFVEGTFDDGGSKNKFQEKILTALNFPGSALEQLISGVVLPDPGTVGAVPASASAPQTPAVPSDVGPTVVPETPAAPAAPTMPSAPAMPTMPPMPQ
ncbi:structural protein [Pectobacterium phage PPWS1]|uniref:Structural protein n=1 Tax=Pectobacterium phage PPWS1 TaxID=1685500 RepID=A0A0P0UWC5_9CAUD|nr:structural protein [Pectobacterium phage PPWS1]BAS69536.1 structural protein [Pectobacterium phage PPWS1]